MAVQVEVDLPGSVGAQVEVASQGSVVVVAEVDPPDSEVYKPENIAAADS